MRTARAALLFAALGLSLVLSSGAWAHGGGLDTLGCHHDRKRGGYHCHRGPLAGQYFESKDQALRALQQGRNKQPSK